MTSVDEVTAALTHLAAAREQVPVNERPLITDTANVLCLLLERLLDTPRPTATWKTSSEKLTGRLEYEDDERVILLVGGRLMTRFKHEQVSGLPRTDYELRVAS